MQEPLQWGDDIEAMEAVLTNPDLYTLAELIPDRDPVKGGRPLSYTKWQYLVMACATFIYKGASPACKNLKGKKARLCAEILIEAFPDDETRRWPKRWMDRRQWGYFKRRYLAQDAIFERLRDVFEARAVAQALEQGLGVASAGGTLTNPVPERMIRADGKVIAPVSRYNANDKRIVDRKTGELKPRRFDRDATEQPTGAGSAHGNKFVMPSMRGRGVHNRVILSVAEVRSGQGGEWGQMNQILGRLAPQLPDVMGVIYDGAALGVHHQEVMTKLGWMVVSPVTAAEDPNKGRRTPTHRYDDAKNAGRGKKKPKRTFIERRSIQGTDRAVRKHDLYAEHGKIGCIKHDAAGRERFYPFIRLEVRRTQRTDGTWRWAILYEVPQMFGGGTVWVRADRTREDAFRKGFNRPENVRVMPEDEPIFDEIYRTRNDCEAINSQHDRWIPFGRALSVGWRRQRADLLFYGLVVNSWSRYGFGYRAREALAA